MIHMKVKPFLHVNHNVWFLFIVVFLNESRETAWEMYLPLLCHWGWKRRHEWTQDLYFCANNSKKWGPELVKRGPERTQDLYSGLYSEKGRSWVSEKRSRADSGPLFWTLQWKREVLSLWKELLRVSHFLKLPLQKPPLFLHHGEQCAPPPLRTGQNLKLWVVGGSLTLGRINKSFWFRSNLPPGWCVVGSAFNFLKKVYFWNTLVCTFKIYQLWIL